MEERNLHPLRYLASNDDKIGLIILNQPVADYIDSVKFLWQKAVVRGVADGGINQLHAAVQNDDQLLVPDFINGDFDSASEDLLKLYGEKGTEILHTPDQDKTDFTKCVEILLEKLAKKNAEISAIVVMASLGGRFDHTMANLHTSILARHLTRVPVYLHDQFSLAVPLQKGTTNIYHRSGFDGDWCGLIPIGCSRAKVTTTGLEWNLDNTYLQFGSMISTSNKTLSPADHVTVTSDEPLVWTMAIR